MTKHQGLQTRLVHAGELSPKLGGAAVLPIFQSSVFEHTPGGSYSDIAYPRLNTLPNQTVLGRKLAALEQGERGLVLSSGMAAISTTLLTVLKSGDHLLIQDSLYGGTYGLVTREFPALGIDVDFIDGTDPSTWAAKRRPSTRAIYVEAITNPLLRVADHRTVVEFAKAHDLLSIIDNTFATPVNFQPLTIGYDISIHSCTKYLNGHSDLVAGAIVGSGASIENITHRLNHLGGCLDPHACFLLHRGIKTLALRLNWQNQSALRIAQFLTSHGSVKTVNYPGLDDHPQYQLAQSLFSGYGGMLSFELRDGPDAAQTLFNRLELPLQAPSLGGPETLVTRPATTSHSGMSRAEREAQGISDGLIRMSVGIEDADDLITDLYRALG